MSIKDIDSHTRAADTKVDRTEKVESREDYNASSSNSSSKGVSCTSVGVLTSNVHVHKDTLLYKLGGRETLRMAVDRFYDCLIQDELLKPFFAKTNMKILKWHQFNFMSIAFDNTITDDFDLSTLILTRHQHLFDVGMNEVHFDRMMEYFVDTFQEIQISQQLIGEALSILLRLRPIFVQGAKEAQQRRQASRTAHTIHFTLFVALISYGAFRLSRNIFNRK